MHQRHARDQSVLLPLARERYTSAFGIGNYTSPAVLNPVHLNSSDRSPMWYLGYLDGQLYQSNTPDMDLENHIQAIFGPQHATSGFYTAQQRASWTTEYRSGIIAGAAVPAARRALPPLLTGALYLSDNPPPPPPRSAPVAQRAPPPPPPDVPAALPSQTPGTPPPRRGRQAAVNARSSSSSPSPHSQTRVNGSRRRSPSQNGAASHCVNGFH